MSDPTPLVALRGIHKRFGDVVANEDVTLDVLPGEVHAILGENGAGKTTLMRILYGLSTADRGTIEVLGRAVSIGSPKDALRHGIGMVTQHFALVGPMTVIDNVLLTSSGLGPLDRRAARERVLEVVDHLGVSINPDAVVEELSVGEQQRVEIIKALYQGAKVLILDEPTAVLVPQEVDELFANLRELKREGITILFISHKLDEVLAAADDITVIRAGTTVATVKPADVTTKQLAELMVGSALPTPETRESTVTDQVELTVEGLGIAPVGLRPTLADVSFEVHRGEIVGIAGIEGNGQTELIAAILGLIDLNEGSVHLGDEDITTWSTRRRREAGIGYVPEDRQRHALLLDAPLWENQILGHQSEAPNAKGPWIDRAGARERTQEIVDRFDVRTPNIEVRAEALSGGNQQKLIIGRELMAEPQVMIAAHPTRGVDVGAQAAIWDQLRDARKAGLATLLISADLPELIGLSDRLLVMFEGRIVAELDPATATPTTLGEHMTGSAREEDA